MKCDYYYYYYYYYNNLDQWRYIRRIREKRQDGGKMSLNNQVSGFAASTGNACLGPDITSNFLHPR